MLIKASTKENDDCFVLFGGSGSELVLCKELNRNFISCEIHTEYYQMILDRLNNGGKISEKYRLQYVLESQRNRKEPMPLLEHKFA
jgi:site-specific DNA-methyltransferase (adenine-specific)